MIFIRNTPPPYLPLYFAGSSSSTVLFNAIIELCFTGLDPNRFLQIETILDLLGDHFCNSQRRRGPRRRRISDMQDTAPYVPCSSVKHEIVYQISLTVHRLGTNSCWSSAIGWKKHGFRLALIWVTGCMRCVGCEKVKARERNAQGRRVAEEEARERDTLEIASRGI